MTLCLLAPSNYRFITRMNELPVIGSLRLHKDFLSNYFNVSRYYSMPKHTITISCCFKVSLQRSFVLPSQEKSQKLEVDLTHVNKTEKANMSKFRDQNMMSISQQTVRMVKNQSVHFTSYFMVVQTKLTLPLNQHYPLQF